MKLTSNVTMKPDAQALSDAQISAQHQYVHGEASAAAGWTLREGAEDGPWEPEVLEAFTLGTKQLAAEGFGKFALEAWNDDLSYEQEENESYGVEDFVEELGYLDGFTGQTLDELVTYYLSPAAIENAGWDHMFTLAKEDGTQVAYGFCPMSFREHDGFLWVHDVATGHGHAVEHDVL